MKEYKVVKIGEKYAVVRSIDETLRPVGEKTYSQKTHAYRRCRHLNKAALEIDEMIKRDGAIIL